MTVAIHVSSVTGIANAGNNVFKDQIVAIGNITSNTNITINTNKIFIDQNSL
jgi:hypothetical protein